MGVLWLSARAEYILKCNMTPSLPCSFFLPSSSLLYLKECFAYQPSPPVPVFPAMLWSCSSLALFSPLAPSVQVLKESLQFPWVCRLSLWDTRATLLPARCSPCSCHQPPGLSSAPHLPRPSPLDAVLSVALQSVSTTAACAVPSCPVLTQSIGSLLCGPSLLSPIQPSLLTAGLLCPASLWAALLTLILHFVGSVSECWRLTKGEAVSCPDYYLVKRWMQVVSDSARVYSRGKEAPTPLCSGGRTSMAGIGVPHAYIRNFLHM